MNQNKFFCYDFILHIYDIESKGDLTNFRLCFVMLPLTTCQVTYSQLIEVDSDKILVLTNVTLWNVAHIYFNINSKWRISS